MLSQTTLSFLSRDPPVPLTPGRHALFNINDKKRCLRTVTLRAPFRIYHGTGAAIASDDRLPTEPLAWFSGSRFESVWYQHESSKADRTEWDFGGVYDEERRRFLLTHDAPFYVCQEDIDESGNVYAYDVVRDIPLLLDLRDSEVWGQLLGEEMRDLEGTAELLSAHGLNGWIAPNEIAILTTLGKDEELRDFLSVDLASEKHWINPELRKIEDMMATYASNTPLYVWKSHRGDWAEAVEDWDHAPTVCFDVEELKLAGDKMEDTLFVESWEDWNSLVNILEYTDRSTKDKSPKEIIWAALDEFEPKAIVLSHLMDEAIVLPEEWAEDWFGGDYGETTLIKCEEEMEE